jgi:hypothetical protein
MAVAEWKFTRGRLRYSSLKKEIYWSWRSINFEIRKDFNTIHHFLC